jgi:PAS domain S-box-containing protein
MSALKAVVEDPARGFQLLVDAITDYAIFLLDANGIVSSWNSGAQRTKGYTRDEIIGQHFSRFFTAEDQKCGKPAQALAIARAEGKFVEEAWRIRKDGTMFWASVVIHPVRDQSSHEIMGFAKITRDRTEAREAAQAVQRAKDEFLAMISHELRTPLNGIVGLAGLLQDGSLDAQSRLRVKMLRDAGDHLLGVVNDLLDFTKLDVGRLEFEDVSFELDGIVQNVLDLVAHRAHAKSLEIGAYIAPEIPTELIGDSGRLRQILLNLLGNAIKFTEAGSVMVDVRPGGQSSNGIVLEFAVTDTSIGINADDIPRLFQVFGQLDHSASRRAGGTGLGLAICKGLTDRMGGRIWVESTPGKGSVFTFTVTMKAGTGVSGQQGRTRARLNGDRILVLHASGPGSNLLSRQIESRGGVVHAFSCPHDALDAARRAAAAHVPFRAMVVDHCLLGAGAVDFARHVRADSKLRDIRLVLVSTSDYGLESSDPSPRDVGRHQFDARLLKPVPVNTLIYRLTRPSPGSGNASDAPRNGGAPPLRGQPLRILVAEDNQTNQAVIRAMLGKLGHRADSAGNGLEALDAVRDRPYDVVLMDVMMPELDGIAATRQIRALQGRAGQVPVIALTADASAEHHVSFRAAGVQEVLVKPVTLSALQSVLASVERA